MVPTSALSLITRALRVIGECAAEETPDAAKLSDGFDHLQDLMDAFKTQRLMIPSLLRTVVPLSANVQAYTIGAGGMINIPCPTTIEWARLIQNSAITPHVEVPVHILTDQEYAHIRMKDFSSIYAQSIYFDHAWNSGLGTIYVFPIPNVGASAAPLPTPFQPQVIAVATIPIPTPTPYGYRVTALNANGETTPSDEAVVTANRGLSTSGTSDYNVIAWQAVPTATGYKVYRTTGAVGSAWTQPPVLIATAGSAQFSETDAAVPGTPATLPTTNTTGGSASQTQLVLYTPVPFPEFTNYATSYTFPPGWNRVLRLKLAKALAPEYGRPFPSEDELAEAWADVKRVNTRPRELRNDYVDTDWTRSVYDIYSDTP